MIRVSAVVVGGGGEEARVWRADGLICCEDGAGIRDVEICAGVEGPFAWDFCWWCGAGLEAWKEVEKADDDESDGGCCGECGCNCDGLFIIF